MPLELLRAKHGKRSLDYCVPLAHFHRSQVRGCPFSNQAECFNCKCAFNLIPYRNRVTKASDCYSEPFFTFQSARVAFVFESWWVLTDWKYTRGNDSVSAKSVHSAESIQWLNNSERVLSYLPLKSGLVLSPLRERFDFRFIAIACVSSGLRSP